jgi:hypothetical protein
LALLRLPELRLAVLRLAVLRFAVLRLAVLRFFAELRFAVPRFAVVRLAVVRFDAPVFLREEVERLDEDLFAPPDLLRVFELLLAINVLLSGVCRPATLLRCSRHRSYMRLTPASVVSPSMRSLLVGPHGFSA